MHIMTAACVLNITKYRCVVASCTHLPSLKSCVSVLKHAMCRCIMGHWQPHHWRGSGGLEEQGCLGFDALALCVNQLETLQLGVIAELSPAVNVGMPVNRCVSTMMRVDR